MMASNNNTNNNNGRNKQKRTEEDNSDHYSSNNSLSLSLLAPEVVVPPALSFGNMLCEFPDFLSCVLPYIADRTIWNSIASSHKDMYEKSKVTLPPWPLCYKVPSPYCTAWSPCGTRIAFVFAFVFPFNIAIVDQRFGPLRNNGHFNYALVGVQINHLKYSPNGRFLVSTGNDDFVRLWDTVSGNYEQLQKWNMREEAIINGDDYKVSISACSKYIVVSSRTHVFFKDVERGGKTIKSLQLPLETIHNIRFSSNGHAIAIYCQERNGNGVVIKVWRPYLDDNDEDRLITLWRQTKHDRGFRIVTFSHDNSMVAIRDALETEGTLWSVDTNHKYLTKKFVFQGNTGLYFTSDGKYIIFNKENGPILWNIAEGKVTNNTICFLHNGSNTKHNFAAESFSPNNRQCIVVKAGSGNCHITSISQYLCSSITMEASDIRYQTSVV